MTQPPPASLFDQPAAALLDPPAGWPIAPDQAAYHGLAGQIVARIAPHTEADRATRGRTLRVSYADWRIG